MTGEYIHIPNGPVSMNIQLGWTVTGPMLAPSDEESTSLVTHVLKVTMSMEEPNRRLERRLQWFWDSESIGICDEEWTVGFNLRKFLTNNEKRCLTESGQDKGNPRPTRCPYWGGLSPYCMERERCWEFDGTQYLMK